MEKHIGVCKIIRILNQTNSSIKRSVIQSEPFRNKKCRLRLENATRWSSGFLMLESIKRAYDRGVIDESEFPVRLEIIELYLQILKPAYLLNVFFQSDHSTIEDTVISRFLT